MDTWIQTYTGKKVDFRNLDPDSIDIKDIARALSLQPRWNGHTSVFFSIAQHSVNVGVRAGEIALNNCPDKRLVICSTLAGLLHDATEAYMSDVPSPLKHILPEYVKIEKELLKMIFSKYIPWKNTLKGFIWQCVEKADYEALVSEALFFFQSNHGWIREGSCGLPFSIEPILAKDAEELFLKTFFILTKRLKEIK